jgi:hypothetical protein
MASFKLDFHRAPEGIAWLGWSLLTAGLLAAVAVAYLAQGLELRAEEVATLQEQSARSERALRERSEVVETPEQQATRERLAQWSQQALTPLKVIEMNWSDQLTMVQLTLSRDDASLAIEFEASALKEGMDLHRRLLKSGFFREVRLLRHALAPQSGPGAVLMAIELHWGDAK